MSVVSPARGEASIRSRVSRSSRNPSIGEAGASRSRFAKRGCLRGWNDQWVSAGCRASSPGTESTAESSRLQQSVIESVQSGRVVCMGPSVLRQCQTKRGSAETAEVCAVAASVQLLLWPCWPTGSKPTGGFAMRVPSARGKRATVFWAARSFDSMLEFAPRSRRAAGRYPTAVAVRQGPLSHAEAHEPCLP